jgi:Spy/CpxP family protein refolding chaperone
MHGPMMKQMISARLDEAMNQANVTPEQRTAIVAARDRAFAAMDASRPDGRIRDQMLSLFETDRLDVAQLQALHAQEEQRHQQVRVAIAQAIVDVHNTLTPAQRKIVADYVRAHRPGPRS